MSTIPYVRKLCSDIVYVCFQGYAAHRDDRNKRCYINKISSNFQDDAPRWAKTTTVRVSTIILLRMFHLPVSDVRSMFAAAEKYIPYSSQAAVKRAE